MSVISLAELKLKQIECGKKCLFVIAVLHNLLKFGLDYFFKSLLILQIGILDYYRQIRLKYSVLIHGLNILANPGIKKCLLEHRTR